MESYCVRCKKNTKNIQNPKVSNASNGKTIQNVRYAVVKIQDLLEIKKQKG